MTCADALRLLLDQVDFRNHACGLTDTVGACIPPEVFDRCDEAILLARRLEGANDAARDAWAMRPEVAEALRAWRVADLDGGTSMADLRSIAANKVSAIAEKLYPTVTP